MHSSELIFLHSDHFPRCRTTVDKYFEGYFSLQLIAGGEVVISYDDKRFLLSGVWFWTAYPGPRIRFHSPSSAPWNHRYAAFRGPAASCWQAEGLIFPKPRRCPRGREKEFIRRFDQILDILRRGGRWSQARAIHGIEGILLDLAVTARHHEKVEPWLENLLAKLDAVEGLAPDYAALARGAGMSVTTMRRKFRAMTGTPVHTYVMEKRIAEARRLLGSTDEPIKDIAEMLGYQDVYFFTRQFKRIQGLPPAVFRKSRQAL